MMQRGWRLLAKRAFDRASAAALLVGTAPLMAATAALVRVKLGGPVLFRQRRPGLRGEIFEVYKFRTMTDERDASGRLLPDAERLTRFGRMLRRTSLDELPQLINVVRGDISLVGPRPLMPQYLERYTPEQMRRHDVLPGITGYAQVRGRNAISWDEKFRHDLHYVDNWSLTLDAKILLETVTAILRRDAEPEGALTMPEFMGSSQGNVAGSSKHEEKVNGVASSELTRESER